jgi:hypothetical protein
MTRPGRYPQELRERAVRLVFEHQDEHPSQWAAICSIAHKFGVSAETLRKWVRRAEIDEGSRPGLTTQERERRKGWSGRCGSCPCQPDPQGGLGFLRVNARMRPVRWGSLVSSLPRLWLVACPAMCGPTGRSARQRCA